MRLWHNYKSFIEDHTAGNKENSAKDISYWQERLFTNLVIYSFPVCFIALVPGLFIWIKSGHVGIAIFELLVVCASISIAVSKKIQLLHRKIFVVLMFYCIAILLIAYIGASGPGGMYLLAIGIFVPLILPLYVAYWSIAINFLICTGFALIIYFKPFHIPIIDQYGVGAFIGVFSNSIFLNLVGVLLISHILRGLEDTLLKELFLQKELQKEGAERMLSNERLKESEAHYKSLFILSPSPMWVLDSISLRFLQVNESAITKYGYTNDEFMSMTAADITLEEDMDVAEDDLQKNIDQGAPLSIFTKHRKKNQEEFYAEVISNAIPFKGKSGILVISEDISLQVDYIKAIEIQNNKLRDIGWIQSHKVRSPLAAILGLVDLLNGHLSEEEFKDVIDGILVSSEKLDRVIRETTHNTSAYNVDNKYPAAIARLSR